MPSLGRALNKFKGNFTLIGDKELKRKLDTLPDKVYKRVVRVASRKSMQPVAKAMKAKAPRETGLLKKSIGLKVKGYKRAGIVVTLVGPRTGFKTEVIVDTPNGPRKEFRDPTKYAHLVEFGTAPHDVGKDRERYQYNYALEKGKQKRKVKTKVKPYKHPGTAAQPFARPAFDENKGKIISVFRSEMASGVVEDARKKA